MAKQTAGKPKKTNSKLEQALAANEKYQAGVAKYGTRPGAGPVQQLWSSGKGGPGGGLGGPSGPSGPAPMPGSAPTPTLASAAPTPLGSSSLPPATTTTQIQTTPIDEGQTQRATEQATSSIRDQASGMEKAWQEQAARQGISGSGAAMQGSLAIQTGAQQQAAGAAAAIQAGELERQMRQKLQNAQIEQGWGQLGLGQARLGLDTQLGQAQVAYQQQALASQQAQYMAGLYNSLYR